MNNWVMDPRRLRLLLALSRLGSMRAVADSFNMTTSTVSQQIGALAKETRTQLIEPEGRRVRLTPAGRRLAVLAELATTHPGVEVIVSEYEPIEAFRLLADDELDLALTYDYNLAPASPDAVLDAIALWTTEWGLAVPTDAPDVVRLSDYADHPWIVNSRNTADEKAVRTLASLAGFSPHIAHQIDSLDLVEDLILAGYGVGLLPVGRPARDGLKVLALDEPSVVMTAYAGTRRGRSTWPPLRLVVDRLRPAGRRSPALESWPRATG